MGVIWVGENWSGQVVWSTGPRRTYVTESESGACEEPIDMQHGVRKWAELEGAGGTAAGAGCSMCGELAKWIGGPSMGYTEKGADARTNPQSGPHVRTKRTAQRSGDLTLRLSDA